jgi:hypothetical protein
MTMSAITLFTYSVQSAPELVDAITVTNGSVNGINNGTYRTSQIAANIVMQVPDGRPVTNGLSPYVFGLVTLKWAAGCYQIINSSTEPIDFQSSISGVIEIPGVDSQESNTLSFCINDQGIVTIDGNQKPSRHNKAKKCKNCRAYIQGLKKLSRF